MGIKVGIVSESAPGEKRVAMVPGAISVLNKSGVEFLMEPGAGANAGFPDSEYAEKGVRLAAREEVLGTAEVVLQVRSPGANPEAGAGDLALFRRGQVVIGFGEPLTALDAARDLARAGVAFLSMAGTAVLLQYGRFVVRWAGGFACRQSIQNGHQGRYRFGKRTGREARGNGSGRDLRLE